MTISPKPGEIWLVKFPFSDLTSFKLRPALILAIHREEVIILGIFIPNSYWELARQLDINSR